MIYNNSSFQSNISIICMSILDYHKWQVRIFDFGKVGLNVFFIYFSETSLDSDSCQNSVGSFHFSLKILHRCFHAWYFSKKIILGKRFKYELSIYLLTCLAWISPMASPEKSEITRWAMVLIVLMSFTMLHSLLWFLFGSKVCVRTTHFFLRNSGRSFSTLSVRST